MVFQEKKVAATKEKEEADEQHTKATEKLRIAEEAKERATKEREDCVKAQARLEKEVSTTACTRLSRWAGLRCHTEWRCCGRRSEHLRAGVSDNYVRLYELQVLAAVPTASRNRARFG